MSDIISLEKIVEKLKFMGCNCDLDNWQPEQTTGHSWVCRIHKKAVEIDSMKLTEEQAIGYINAYAEAYKELYDEMAVLYENQYGKRYKRFFSFNNKCKNCQTEMEELRSDGENTFGTKYLYWCPHCGTTLDWYDAYDIKDDDWKIPVSSID